jgi:hypothetical protein
MRTTPATRHNAYANRRHPSRFLCAILVCSHKNNHHAPTLPNREAPLPAARHQRKRVLFRYKIGCGGCTKPITCTIQAIEPCAQVGINLRADLVSVAADPAEPLLAAA